MRQNLFIVGKMGAGKDTAAEILVKKYHYHSLAIADRIRTIAALLYPRIFANGDRNARRIKLQRLGDTLRTEDPQIFNNALYDEILVKNLHPVLISDVRFVAEYNYFTARGFVPVKLVTRDDIRMERLKSRDGVYPSREALAHPSENQLADDETRFFHNLTNNFGVQELEIELDALMPSLDTANGAGNGRIDTETSSDETREAEAVPLGSRAVLAGSGLSLGAA